MIKFHAVEWDDPDEPQGNVQHIGEHGLTPVEVEEILRGGNGTDDFSRSTGRHLRFGWTSTGRHIVVAYKIKQGRTLTVICPITAYDVDPH